MDVNSPTQTTPIDQTTQQSGWTSDFTAQVKGVMGVNSWVRSAVEGVSQYANFPATQLAIGLGVLAGGYWAVDKAVNESECLTDVMVNSVQHSLRGVGLGAAAGAMWPITATAAIKFLMKG